jgi:competence protein ComEA
VKTLLASLLAAFSLSSWAAVDLNRATQSELEAVKGIGPAKAQAILDYRQQHGPFRSVEALAEVRGFGRASVAKLKHALSVEPAAKSTGPRKPSRSPGVEHPVAPASLPAN